MPVTTSYPGIYIEELPSSSRTITAAPTSITAFIGYAHPFEGDCANPQSPHWNEAIRIFNFAEYERWFGGFYNNGDFRSDLADAVYQFFLNGGSDAYVVGLKPMYFLTAQGAQPQAITGATGTLSNISFTGKQLTTDKDAIRVAIRNIRANLADLTITFGQRVETYPDVETAAGAGTLYALNKNFIANRLATSRLVSVSPTAIYPATFTTPPAFVELGALTPPSQAWSPSRASDYLGVFAATSSLSKVRIFNLLVLPGVSHSGVWSAALSFCELHRAFYIIDAPPNYSADGVNLPAIDTAAMPDLVPNGALYYPYLKRLDPFTNKTVATPPSGYVAGVYARTDTRRGVWKAPAGLETTVVNTLGPVDEGVMTDMRQGVLNPLGINVLRTFPGSGTVVWGARTLASDNTALQQWKYVPVRRTALFIEQTLEANLKWVVFEPNDEPLWWAIRMTIGEFMLSLFRQGAFQGSTPSEAFLVQCDHSTTTDTDINNGIVNIVVGFRPLKPAEFVIIKIAQLAGQVQA